MRTLLLSGLLLGLLCRGTRGAEMPAMKFNEVRELAPGVFFRYSAISATDKSVVFGGSNNVWVVFGDFVVVIDANFPKEAHDVIAAIHKTTSKPIRYVFDTHHHGDHAWGNGVFSAAGAGVIAQSKCARILRETGPREYAEASRGPNARKDLLRVPLKTPDVVFDDKLVLDDGTQRIEFLHFGHGHTAGDAVAYLPGPRILCTGDACVNGAFNYMGNSDSASWIRALERMQQLDVRLVCPGHGRPAGKDLLQTQKHYFEDLRRLVRRGIDERHGLEDIVKTADLPWYREWTGVSPPGENIRHVYDELSGRLAPSELLEDYGIYEGPSPTKQSPGWTTPRRIVVPSGLMPDRLNELKAVASEVEFIPAASPEQAVELAADADAAVGFCSAELLRAGKRLRWIQAGRDGVPPEVSEMWKERRVVLTDTQAVYGPPNAEHALGLILTLVRGRPVATQEAAPAELQGKTIVIIGLGGVGTQIARRAHAFGMRVRAIDPHQSSRADFIFSLDGLNRLNPLLHGADFIVLACPLSSATIGLIGADQFAVMKKTAYLINVARARLVRIDALVRALEEQRVAGAALDVTDPVELPAEHPLRRMKNVVVSSARNGHSPEAAQRQWRLIRENVRRFACGEPLLCVVEMDKGWYQADRP